MHPLYALLVCLPTLTLTASPPPQPPLYTATLYHLPTTTPSTPHPLVTLLYNPSHPTLSRLKSLTPPPNSTADPDALTQIALYLPNADPRSEHYRSSAASIRGFHAPYKGRFRIVVDPEDGEVVGASWVAWMPRGGEGEGGREGSGRGDFDVVTVKKAPSVVFDKPVKGKGGAAAGAAPVVEGEEEVVEKTLLQK